MRGKVGYIHPFCHGVGITPAYAGKRSAGREFGTAAWDHPRACGEKAMSVTTMNKSQGSPPRMRGKATGSSCVKLNSQDHPRVCGEKPERKAPRRPRLGSPPRMRGKETDSRRQCCSAGITPAYAGKRTLFCLAGRRNRDHPRVCGEKCSDHIDKGMIEGSPPRMRGKVLCICPLFCVLGITPAYAGKRAEQAHSMSCSEDHPRVCGEKSGSCFFLSIVLGSPPRMRGKVV